MPGDLILIDTDTHVQDIQPFERIVPFRGSTNRFVGKFETDNGSNATEPDYNDAQWNWFEDPDLSATATWVQHPLAHTGSFGANIQWRDLTHVWYGISLGGGFGPNPTLDITDVTKVQLWIWHERDPDATFAFSGWQDDLELRFYGYANGADQNRWASLTRLTFVRLFGGEYLPIREREWFLIEFDMESLLPDGLAGNFVNFNRASIGRFDVLIRHSSDGTGNSDRRYIIDDVILTRPDRTDIILRSEATLTLRKEESKDAILFSTTNDVTLQGGVNTILHKTKPPGKVL